MPAQFTSEVIVLDRLIAGNSGLLVSRRVTLASGQNLKRGAVLGKVAADGKYVLSEAASGDGSEVPDAILVEDADASAADKPALIYVRGDFLQGYLTLGTGHTVESVREGLRTKGIMLFSSMI